MGRSSGIWWGVGGRGLVLGCEGLVTVWRIMDGGKTCLCGSSLEEYWGAGRVLADISVDVS